MQKVLCHAEIAKRYMFAISTNQQWWLICGAREWIKEKNEEEKYNGYKTAAATEITKVLK